MTGRVCEKVRERGPEQRRVAVETDALGRGVDAPDVEARVRHRAASDVASLEADAAHGVEVEARSRQQVADEGVDAPELALDVGDRLGARRRRRPLVARRLEEEPHARQR